LSGFADDAVAALLAARNDNGGWGYRSGAASATEPTAAALLALHAIDRESEVRDQAVAWLLGRQTAEGGFSAADGHEGNSWTTGLVLTALLRAGDSSAPDAAAPAADWLVASNVFTLPAAQAASFGYDTTLVGWAWTDGDFSFPEPTSFALIGLKQSTHKDHARVTAGEALLRDRFTTDNGWNFGEPNVLGNDVPAQIAPTALALLALQDKTDEMTQAAVQYLQAKLPTLTALMSLGYTANALLAWQAADDTLPETIEQRWRAVPSARRGNLETALLLLAGAARDRNGLIFG